MAVTYITRIYATIEKSVDYIVRDKVVLSGDEMNKALRDEAMNKVNDYLKNALDYISKDKTISDENKGVEIRKTLTSTINCIYDEAKKEFNIVRDRYHADDLKGNKIKGEKRKEILGYHVWQSFEENIDQKLSHEIGIKLAKELFGDFQCVVSTHDNTDHTHNHIVFNAVSYKTGKKYNICTANTKKLREVSDRLCEEYGLSVLQETKNMNIRWYKDKDGKWKSFEPTERKINKDKYKYDNVAYYKNYEAYENSEKFKNSNCKTIRRDIDRFIPLSSNLDDLIGNLRLAGYEVKNLNAKGDELKYISFKAPSHSKFTRGNENTLGKEYTRESLIRKINENGISKSKDITVPEQPKKKTSNYKSPVYVYGELDIEGIDEEKRIRYVNKNKCYEEVPRSEVEVILIKDTKRLNRILDKEYRKVIEIPTFKESVHIGKDAKTKYQIDRINENLRALQFIENKNIKSFGQINATVQSLYEKRNEVNNEFLNIKSLLGEMNKEIILVKKYNQLKNSIEANKGNSDYVQFELQGDMDLLRQYEAMLKQMKLLTKESQVKKIEAYNKFNERFNDLVKAFGYINDVISDYDRTIYTVNRIDTESDRRYEKEIEKYNSIKNDNRLDSSK